jgi:hypothetical protein
VTDPYGLLAAFARRQHEAIADGQLGALDDTADTWRELILRLPPVAPESARAALEAAQEALASGIAQLELRREEARRELSQAGRSRQVAASYGHGEAQPALDATG